MCVTFNLILRTTHFKSPKIASIFLLLTKCLKLQPFPASPSCRTWNQENLHSASRAGLARRMSSSLQMCTWSSGSCSSSSKQVFVCLKWHQQPVQPVGQSQNKSFPTRIYCHGILSCSSHSTQPQSSGGSGGGSGHWCSCHGLTREGFHFQL